MTSRGKFLVPGSWLLAFLGLLLDSRLTIHDSRADDKKSSARADLSRLVRNDTARVLVSNAGSPGGQADITLTLAGGPAVANVESITFLLMDGQYGIEPGWTVPKGWQAEEIRKGAHVRKLVLKPSGLASGGSVRLRLKRTEPGPGDDWMSARKIDKILANHITVEEQEARGPELGLYDIEWRVIVRYRDGREEYQDLSVEVRDPAGSKPVRRKTRAEEEAAERTAGGE